MYMYIYTYLHISTYTCTYVYVNTYIYIYIYIHIYFWTHSHPPTCKSHTITIWCVGVGGVLVHVRVCIAEEDSCSVVELADVVYAGVWDACCQKGKQSRRAVNACTQHVCRAGWYMWRHIRMRYIHCMYVQLYICVGCIFTYAVIWLIRDVCCAVYTHKMYIIQMYNFCRISSGLHGISRAWQWASPFNGLEDVGTLTTLNAALAIVAWSLFFQLSESAVRDPSSVKGRMPPGPNPPPGRRPSRNTTTTRGSTPPPLRAGIHVFTQNPGSCMLICATCLYWPGNHVLVNMHVHLRVRVWGSFMLNIRFAFVCFLLFAAAGRGSSPARSAGSKGEWFSSLKPMGQPINAFKTNFTSKSPHNKGPESERYWNMLLESS